MVSCRPGRAARAYEVMSMARSCVPTSRGRPRRSWMLYGCSRCATRARVCRCRAARDYAGKDVDSLLVLALQFLPFNCLVAPGPSRLALRSSFRNRCPQPPGRGSVFEYSPAAGVHAYTEQAMRPPARAEGGRRGGVRMVLLHRIVNDLVEPFRIPNQQRERALIPCTHHRHPRTHHRQYQNRDLCSTCATRQRHPDLLVVPCAAQRIVGPAIKHRGFSRPGQQGRT